MSNPDFLNGGTDEVWFVDDLKNYPLNTKIHSEAQVELLACDIERFGLTNPPHIEPNGTIIAGHGRVQAFRKRGWRKIPVRVRHDLNAEQIRVLRLSDNQLSSTEYDLSLLKEEMRELKELSSDEDLTLLTGFNEREISMMLTDLGQVSELSPLVLAAEPGAAASEQNFTAEVEIDNADNAFVPLAKAFGFKSVTVAQSRAFKRHLLSMEEQTGKTGAEALLAFIEQYIKEVSP